MSENSLIWLIIIPIMKAGRLLSPAAYPRERTRGRVRHVITHATAKALATTAPSIRSIGMLMPSVMKKSVTPRVLIGSTLDEGWGGACVRG